MERLVSAVSGQPFTSLVANEWQEKTQSLAAANTANDFAAAAVRGTDSRLWQIGATPLATGTFLKIDTSTNWLDRLLWGKFVALAANANRAGQSGDHNLHSSTVTEFFGYTGNGSEKAAGGVVTAGNPPVATGFGGTPESWRVRLNGATDTIWLFVDKTDFSLGIYNNSGSSINPILLIHGSAETGKR